MVIIKEKQKLDEMAILVVSSLEELPFRIAIKSPDHQPPHVHIMDKETGKKEIGQFLLTFTPPKKPEDIRDYKQGVSNEMRELIFRWAKSPNKRAWGKLTNWEALGFEWQGNEM
jgi:hypothetical protein